MPTSTKKSLREGYNRLKKVFEKILRPKKEQSWPPLAWQPYRHKKNLRGTDLR